MLAVIYVMPPRPPNGLGSPAGADATFTKPDFKIIVPIYNDD